MEKQADVLLPKAEKHIHEMLFFFFLKQITKFYRGKDKVKEDI